MVRINHLMVTLEGKGGLDIQCTGRLMVKAGKPFGLLEHGNAGELLLLLLSPQQRIPAALGVKSSGLVPAQNHVGGWQEFWKLPSSGERIYSPSLRHVMRTLAGGSD